jgi:cell division topological specificity factor
MTLLQVLRPMSSAPVARERLQILLEYERRLVSQTDLIAVLLVLRKLPRRVLRRTRP